MGMIRMQISRVDKVEGDKKKVAIFRSQHQTKEYFRGPDKRMQCCYKHSESFIREYLCAHALLGS